MGHYPWTALPGQVGNSAFAGHRAGHGSPFLDFDRLKAGDAVELAQGRMVWVYRLVSNPRVIPISADWVLDPCPGRALTLTTCWPRYGSSMRMFVRGELVRVTVGSRTVYRESGPGA
jgi:sortase A